MMQLAIYSRSKVSTMGGRGKGKGGGRGKGRSAAGTRKVSSENAKQFNKRPKSKTPRPKKNPKKVEKQQLLQPDSLPTVVGPYGIPSDANANQPNYSVQGSVPGNQRKGLLAVGRKQNKKDTRQTPAYFPPSKESRKP